MTQMNHISPEVMTTEDRTADPPTPLVRGLRERVIVPEAIATKEQTADPPTPLIRGLRQKTVSLEAIAMRQYQLRELVTVYVDEMDLLAWAIACEQFANQLRDKAASFYGNSESYR